MGNRITLYLDKSYDHTLLPVSAAGYRYRDWWEDNTKTADHAKHCLPLAMANSLGYYILSPGTFTVRWNGDTKAPAQITPLQQSSHYQIDNHATFGGFTVQTKFVPVTKDPGDFVYVKGIPNERDTPYQCMEACIEAWWSVADFGLVFLITQKGEFTIKLGQPIAQFFLLPYRAGTAGLLVNKHELPGKAEWHKKRTRPNYQKDFDYLTGLHANGNKEETHITNWKSAIKYGTPTKRVDKP